MKSTNGAVAAKREIIKSELALDVQLNRSEDSNSIAGDYIDDDIEREQVQVFSDDVPGDFVPIISETLRICLPEQTMQDGHCKEISNL